MKNRFSQSSTVAVLTGAFVATGVIFLSSFAHADKVKISTKPISSGPIRSNGDEPGTLKEVVRMRITNPPSQPTAPPNVEMTFHLFIESSDPTVDHVHFVLASTTNPRLRRVTSWDILQVPGRVILKLNGSVVAEKTSPLITPSTNFTVYAQSNALDLEAYPFGSWGISMTASSERSGPYINVPCLPNPVPVPYPRP